MRTNVWLWIVAGLLTLVLGAWQRVSGPTYPLYGEVRWGDRAVNHYKLERTHAGPGDHEVRVHAVTLGDTATLEWREHRESATWTSVPMTLGPQGWTASIPHHGPGQKVDYRIREGAGKTAVSLPAAGFATLRFRNDVPAWVLIPHIVCMMGALLLALRVAFEACRREPDLKLLTLRTLAATFLGGFPLGLMVSGYAFGQPWGGFPIGNDATDNKTLLAFLGWIIATLAVFRGRNPRATVLAAAALMLFVYLVPHSFAMPH